MSLEVSAPQKAVLDRDLGTLPREAAAGPVEGGTELPSLFYHPNSAARVLALVVSAGYDALNGRQPNAERKIDRATEVFTLVADDSAGRGHLGKLKELLKADVGGFLSALHGETAPYLHNRMEVGARAAAPKNTPQAQPHALEAGEQAHERLSVAARPAPAPRPPRPVEEVVVAPHVDEQAHAHQHEHMHEHVEEHHHHEPVDPYEAGAGRHRHGPSDDEAAAAAAAALAAMEAPYEDVVVEAQRRFDPDRDLEPDESRGGNRRDRGGRRGGRSLEGLERPKPDQVRPLPQEAGRPPQGERRPREEGEGAPPGEAREPREPREPGPRPEVRAARSCEDMELAEAILDVARQALRMAREQGLGGRLRVELLVGRSEGGPPRERGEGHGGGDGRGDGRGRRRRRRSPRGPAE